jgi:LCP family protein required for cell wall assembly
MRENSHSGRQASRWLPSSRRALRSVPDTRLNSPSSHNCGALVASQISDPMSDTPPNSRSRLLVWLKRTAIALLVLANLGVFYLYWQLRSIEETVSATAETVTEVVPQLTPTLPGSSEPITFLLAGSDSRENLESTEGFGEAGGQRSDVIMLIKIYPEDGKAQVLSLPRDLWVEIPGHGPSKINAAYALGGATLVIETVKDFTGIGINHYVEVDFVGFQEIVDQLGGVMIDFPYPARDSKSHLDVDAGPQNLGGEQALAFARSRSYQELRESGWVSVDADDFGRTARQQQLILAILDQIRRPSSITEAGAIVGSFTEHVTMDAALADSSMIELAFRMRGLRGSGIETATLPGVTDTISGQSVVLPAEPQATEVIDAFKSGGSMQAALGEDDGPLTIAVLNGNGLSGSAGEWSDVLGAAGFVVGSVDDADRSDYLETVIRVPLGEEPRGETIADALGFGRVETGVIPTDVDALVILGADAAGNAG